MKFLTAVALAPLLIASAAQAETVISTKRTTPISTATANNGNPDSILIAEAGSIAITDGTAVTINSNHDVKLEGGVTFTNAANGVTGILVAPGASTSDITIDGGITIDDGYAATDTDKDGDLDGEFATGTDRRGVWVAGDLTGDILMTQDGFLVVEGNNSYGFDIDGNVTGDFFADGRTNVTGDNGYGIRVTGDISGDVRIGDITVQGTNTVGISLEGDIGGGLVFDGTITSTGFRYTQRVTDETVVDALDDDDLTDNGAAIVIAGDVAGGVLFERTQADNDPDEDDEDGDGVDDADETTAQISTFGDAPAVQVGSTTDTVTLGAVGTGDYAYGFVVRGNISASGVWDGYDATAVEIGVDGGMAVDIFGGLRFQEGILTAVAFEANATTLRINANTNANELFNDSVMNATTASEGDFEAVVVLIEAGANTTVFNNAGVLNGTVVGETGTAYGVLDRSGNLSTINNTGVITTSILATADGDDDDTNDAVTGSTVAIDLSANSLGALILQSGVADGDDFDDGIADADADGDGVDDSDEPGIVGDIRLGSGADVLDIRNGAVFGDISFGAGADQLLISGGAQVRGEFSDTDGDLAITVTKGTIEVENVTAVTISSLDIGTDGNLVATVDPTQGTVSGFNVTGTANLADGAGLGIRFTSLLRDTTNFTVISAGDLNAGVLDLTTLSDNTPFVYLASASVVGDDLVLNVRQKTAAELGLIQSEAQAFDAIYDALDQDLALRNQFLSRLDRGEFFDLYRQLMPEHSGAPLLSLAAGIDAVRHALADRTVQAPRGETTAWLQEINFYSDKQRTDTYAFRSEGFGIAGGLERGHRLGNFGISGAYTSSDMKDRTALLDEVMTAQLFELGAYYRLNTGNWRAWGRGAAGYAMFDQTREVITPGFIRRAKGEWDGWSASAGVGASYDMRWRKWYGRAEGSLEYFMLNESAYCESGVSEAVNLCYQDRQGHLLKAEATMNIGRRFGEETWFTPEIRFGYRHNISAEAGDTVARFQYLVPVAGGGTTNAPWFALASGNLEGGGPVLGFRLMAGSGMGFLGIEGDAILIDDYELYNLMIRGGFRF